MQCDHCHTEWSPNERDPKSCAHCGASKPQKEYEKSDPFFHAGYIVWCLKAHGGAWFEFVFYKGTTYIGNVRWDFRRMAQYPLEIDIMPLVLKELEYNLGISETPVVEFNYDRIHFTYDARRLLALDRKGIAEEINRQLLKAYGSL